VGFKKKENKRIIEYHTKKSYGNGHRGSKHMVVQSTIGNREFTRKKTRFRRKALK